MRAQEPPHGVAHWLQCWPTGPKKRRTLLHTFSPPVEVTLLRHGEIMDGKEALPLLQKGTLLSSVVLL